MPFEKERQVEGDAGKGGLANAQQQAEEYQHGIVDSNGLKRRSEAPG